MRLIRLLGKHKVALVLVLLLLIGQAFAELSIPRLTSDIVDVGIQQSGVEHVAVDKLSERTYNIADMLLDDEKTDLLEKSYDKNDDGTYDLNDYGRDNIDELDEAMTSPLIAAHGSTGSTGTSDASEGDEGDATSDSASDSGDASSSDSGGAGSSDSGGADADSASDSGDASSNGEGDAAADSTEGAINANSLDNLDNLLNDYQSGNVSGGQMETIAAQLTADLDSADDSLVSQQGIAAARAEYEDLKYDLSSLQMSYLGRTGAGMLAFAAMSMVLAILVGFIAARTGAKTSFELRNSLFKSVMSFNEGEVGHFSAASLITRGTNDIQVIQNTIVMLMRMVLYAPILAIGGVIMVMVTNAALGWIIIVAVVAVLVVIAVLFRVAMPRFRIMQKLIDRVNLIAREILTGLPVVRAFGRESYEEDRFDVASTRLMKTQVFTNRVMAFMMPMMTLIMNATSVGIVWFGGFYVDSGIIQTGDLIAFITYSMVIVMGFMMIGMVAIIIPRADVATRRVEEVLACEPAVQDPDPSDARVDTASRSSAVQGAEIAFHDVSFRYDADSENVLDQVSFTAAPGETLAIVGATGSGKSTIMRLVERFYDVTEGSITIDGIDVRDLSQADLRTQLGYVPQKAFLLSGTVATNVAYGNADATPERIDEALDIAQASDFVAERGGVDTPITQGGANVSGGQRQRLAIARAIATDARAFLFDDSFSALDYKTDAALRHALATRLGEVTCIIVAQRISTVMSADRIVVLDEGRVAGQGPHDDLMRTCDEYRQIALSQLSEAELGQGGDAV